MFLVPATLGDLLVPFPFTLPPHFLASSSVSLRQHHTTERASDGKRSDYHRHPPRRRFHPHFIQFRLKVGHATGSLRRRLSDARRAATEALAVGWPDEPGTLTLLQERGAQQCDKIRYALMPPSERHAA